MWQADIESWKNYLLEILNLQNRNCYIDVEFKRKELNLTHTDSYAILNPIYKTILYKNVKLNVLVHERRPKLILPSGNNSPVDNFEIKRVNQQLLSL